jgi:hypothetical protein
MSHPVLPMLERESLPSAGRCRRPLSAISQKGRYSVDMHETAEKLGAANQVRLCDGRGRG